MGYSVYNKRKKLIVKSIYINFDELKEMSMASDYDNFGPTPQLQKTSVDNGTELGIQDHNNEPSSSKLVPKFVPLADKTYTFLQELDLLCSPMYEEYFTAGNQKVAESFLCNIDTLNMHTFYQRHRSDYQWTKNHPLEQVHGNPSKPMQTRRQLATDPKMFMFALTVSTAKSKNIEEAMTNHAWIKAMQEEIHQFDRLKV
ncbi:hypothetical protein Tco_1121924 [Tanacetum coccineum]|uniref:Gag-Pol polyprotein n=1 Tax=Tanacetum coccineum TaxID=301880 RepID=A0ABQ5IZ94_9ASTR